VSQPGPDLFGNSPTPDDVPEVVERDVTKIHAAGQGWLTARAALCEYGCGTKIVFAATERKLPGGGVKSGWMPVDLDRDPGGNVHLVAEGRAVRAYVLNKAQRAGRDDLHHSHMSTCTQKGKARR
jgi:hypothetical protein